MTRLIFTALLFSILISFETRCQERIVFSELSEVQLVENLKNIDSEIRCYSAKEIRRRLSHDKVKIQKGNIIENPREFWEKS